MHTIEFFCQKLLYLSTGKRACNALLAVFVFTLSLSLSAQQNWVENYAGTAVQADCDGISGGADWGLNAGSIPRAAGPPDYNDASSSDSHVGTFGYNSGPQTVGGSTGSPLVFKCLMLNDYNLNVPNDAVITGLIVYLSKVNQSQAALTEDYEVKLWLPDGSFSENRALEESVDVPQNALAWVPISNYNQTERDTAFTEAIGGENDLWGLTGLTPTVINDPDFGVILKMIGYGGRAIIDAVRIKVFYRQTGSLSVNTTGLVFNDLNNDGIYTPYSESGIAGVNVNAYVDGAPGAAPAASATTDQHGNYALDLVAAGLSTGTPVRIEFSSLPGNHYEGFSGTDNRSNVIFTTAGNHSADFGIYAPHEYDFESNDVPIFTSCYVPGTYDGTNMDSSAVISLSYNGGGRYLGGGEGDPSTFTGINSAGLTRADWGNPTPVKLATHNEVGTVYGLASDRTRNRLYMSSFMKHKTGFGPNGPGAIYRQDVDLTTGQATGPPSLLIDLASDASAIAQGISVAADPHDINGDLTVAGATEAASLAVGKQSLGDLEISDDDTKLYTLNLTDRKVVEIDLPSTSVSKVWDFENGFSFPCGSGNDFRPFGLSYHNGLLYIGAVCTAESTQPGGNAAELHAYVYSIDPACTGSACFSLIVDFPLNNRIGDEWSWKPWVSDWDDFPADHNNFSQTHQPLLSDIEFVDDDMVIALMNRGSEMWGNAVSAPFYAGTPLKSIWAAGDMLRFAWNDVSNSYDPEAFGTAGHRTATFPGEAFDISSSSHLTGAEFYGGDSDYTASGHDEGVYGGVVQIGGRDIVFGQQNATETFNNLAQHGGIGWANNHNGQKTKGYYLLQLFGKANGLGDMEAGYFTPPIMIGNRLWYDADEDGIQDPTEQALSGVRVELLAAGAVIGSVLTNAEGHYFFGGPLDLNLSGISLNSNTDYTVRVALADAQAVVPSIQGITDADIGSDLHDSDAAFDGTYALVPLRTAAEAGNNNYNFDIGFRDSPTPVCMLTDAGKTLETCNDNGTISDVADDYITFSLNPMGTTLGMSYSLSVDNGGNVSTAAGAPAVNIAYGSPTAFRLQTGSADGATSFTLTVTDDTNSSCQVTLTVRQNSCSPCTIPAFSLSSNQGTCNDDTPNDDASLSLSAITNGDQAGISLGSTYSGTNYGSGMNINVSGGTGTFNGLLHNTQYTVRVFDGSDACFSDQTITTAAISCLEFYSLGNRVFYDDDNNGIQDGTDTGIDGVQLQLLNADGTVFDSDDTTPGIQALTLTTGNGGYYRFDDLAPGNYVVEVLPSAFISGGILENYSSSTGAGQETDPNGDLDLNDNGLDNLSGGVIRSGIITLGETEVTGEAEPASYASGSFSGTAAADTESNLTVDFGFYRNRDLPDCCDPVRPLCPDEPCHFISNDIYFGSGVTNDAASNTNAQANADTDDGLAWGDNVEVRRGGTLNLPVIIYNDTGNNAYFRMWIDWNGDGDFDDADEQIADETLAAAMFNGTFTISQIVNIPITALQETNLALRMRISTDEVNSSGPCGTSTCAADGEIEDYLLRISCPSTLCLPVSLNRR